MATTDEAPAAVYEMPTARVAARPDWRRQPHSWFLVGLAAANVAFDGAAAGLLNDGPSPTASLFVGVLLAQLFLMGLWMALGGLRAAARLAAVAVTTLVGTAVFWWRLGNSPPEFWDLAAFAGMIVLATHAVLLPLRALLGWRIDFDPAYHARSTDRSMQLRIIHLIAFTTACALPFALFRILDETETALQVLAFGGIGLVASLPAAWIAVAARRSLRFWIPAGGMLLISLVIDLWALDEMFSSGSWDAIAAYFGIAVTALANLGLLRLFFDLRLFSVLGPAPEAAARHDARLDPELALIVDAWPRLPAALRNELLQQIRFDVAAPDQGSLCKAQEENAGRV